MLVFDRMVLPIANYINFGYVLCKRDIPNEIVPDTLLLSNSMREIMLYVCAIVLLYLSNRMQLIGLPYD